MRAGVVARIVATLSAMACFAIAVPLIVAAEQAATYPPVDRAGVFWNTLVGLALALFGSVFLSLAKGEFHRGED